jgi:hypothetical protein
MARIYALACIFNTCNCWHVLPWVCFSWAALHLEARPICCIRGLKPSLVIGQKAQIGPNSFTPRGRANSLCKRVEILTCDWPKGSKSAPTPLHLEAGPIWWCDFFKLQNVCYDTPWAPWIGCTQNGGSILGLEANIIFHSKKLLK